MKQYYLHDGQNQIGPFSTEELKERNITRETFVWKEGMTDWVKAEEMAELNDLFASIPPPFKAATTNTSSAPDIVTPRVRVTETEKTGMWIGRNPKISVLILVLSVIAGIATYNTMRSSTRNHAGYDPMDTAVVKEKTPEELKRELKYREQVDPTTYLKDKLTMRTNLLGEKVIEGNITNEATAATFKNIVIAVSFLSKTDVVLRTEKFTLYEFIKPQQTIPIGKHKTFAPSETEAFSAVIESAEPVE